MKFFVAALIPLFAGVPSFGQYTFNIAGGDPPATWEVQDVATNQVTITFDISQALVTGDGTIAFHVGTEDCGPNQDDYSISPTPGAKVQDDADPLVVTFVNDQHITATTYCIHVKLMIDGIDTPVATKTFTYEVNAPASGQVVDVEFSTNILFGLTGNIDPGFSVTCLHEDTVAVGQPIVVQVAPLPGFDIEIAEVTLFCGTPVVADNTGKVSYPDKSQVEITFPIACYADADSTIVTFTVTVDWWVNAYAVRRLRLLQESEEPDGYYDYTVQVEIVPIRTNIGNIIATAITGYFEPGLFITSENPDNPGKGVAYGKKFIAQVTSASGFDTQIVGVGVPCGTPVLANNSGKKSIPQSHRSTLPSLFPVMLISLVLKSLSPSPSIGGSTMTSSAVCVDSKLPGSFPTSDILTTPWRSRSSHWKMAALPTSPSFITVLQLPVLVSPQPFFSNKPLPSQWFAALSHQLYTWPQVVTGHQQA